MTSLFPCPSRDLHLQHRKVARLVDEEAYDKVISSKKREQQIRQRLKNLQQYRKNGVSTTEGQCMCILICGEGTHTYVYIFICIYLFYKECNGIT